MGAVKSVGKGVIDISGMLLFCPNASKKVYWNFAEPMFVSANEQRKWIDVHIPTMVQHRQSSTSSEITRIPSFTSSRTRGDWNNNGCVPACDDIPGAGGATTPGVPGTGPRAER